MAFWLFPLSDLQLDFDSVVSFVVLRLARSILLIILLILNDEVVVVVGRLTS